MKRKERHCIYDTYERNERFLRINLKKTVKEKSESYTIIQSSHEKRRRREASPFEARESIEA